MNPMTGALPSWNDLVAGMPTAGLFPPVGDVERGAEMAKYEKYPIEVTDYKVDVFDMSDQGERDRYAKLMKDLFRKVQASKCTICRNELQVMENTWKRYLEWFEYRKNEKSTTGSVEGRAGNNA